MNIVTTRRCAKTEILYCYCRCRWIRARVCRNVWKLYIYREIRSRVPIQSPVKCVLYIQFEGTWYVETRKKKSTQLFQGGNYNNIIITSVRNCSYGRITILYIIVVKSRRYHFFFCGCRSTGYRDDVAINCSRSNRTNNAYVSSYTNLSNRI